MWCGRIDVPVAGVASGRDPLSPPALTTPRETGLAIVLWHLLNAAGEFNTWQDIDRVVQTFFGWVDSMTFAQLGDVLAAADIHTLADVTSTGWPPYGDCRPRLPNRVTRGRCARGLGP